ncbi:hypothetical protein Rumeso_02716 [Rubellimicrobium mesophilum DSM 19309]|uniref:Alkaline phosphatase n=1 Tax=Rubellimicrobium mesophilum DSM 19309 TaxID=442562 RepID=A0A017HPE9_9RHOB|nr:hypothetical protein Rumeso_02716 [Rubellimicrobium mesophilum DSM 19309]
MVNAGTEVETRWQGIEVLQLTLGSGNDSIDVRGVADDSRVTGYAHSITAGAGDDSFAVDLLSLGTLTFAGDEGTDRLTVDWSAATNGITWSDNSLATFVEGWGWVYLNHTGVEDWNITGGSGNDDLRGGSLDDVISAGGGDDDLRGGTGKGTYLGGAGQDLIVATIASKTGAATTQDFVLSLADTQSRTVTVNAGTAFETSWQGVEVVQLTLGSGNDSIDVRGVASARAAHQLDMGSGNDSFAIDLKSLAGATVWGGDGTDRVTLDWSAATNGIVWSGNSLATFVDLRGWVYLNYSGIEAWTVVGGSGDDDIRGGDLDDTLSGGAGNDNLAGGAGKGAYLGGAGQDLVSATIASGGVASTGDFVLRLADTQARTVVVNAGMGVETSWQGIEILDLTLGLRQRCRRRARRRLGPCRPPGRGGRRQRQLLHRPPEPGRRQLRRRRRHRHAGARLVRRDRHDLLGRHVPLDLHRESRLALCDRNERRALEHLGRRR